MTMITSNAELKKALRHRAENDDEVSAFALSLILSIEEGCTCGAAAVYPGNDEIHVEDADDALHIYVTDARGDMIEVEDPPTI